MNLLITTACNLNCPYCFAGSLRKRKGRQQSEMGRHEMTRAELERIVSSLDPEVDPARLMGGEPTLHSEYPEFLRFLKMRGFQVVVFTNGTQPVLRQTAPYLPDRILLNLNDRDFYTEFQIMTILENIALLGERVELGYTITRPDFALDWHRQLILAQGLQPMIRLGLAQPVLGGDNVYLPDADLAEAHAGVAHWAKHLAEDGIRLSLDCGFMRCHFSEAALEDLIRAGTAPRFACSPAVDVGPGLETWRCYAFSQQKGFDWSDFGNDKTCTEWFAQQEMVFDSACTQCQHFKSGWCQGGCRARTMMHAKEY